MTPQEIASKKRIIFGLVALGFVGLIGAHELAVTPPPPGGESDMIVPFIVASAGTLCFVGAGLLARRLMKQIASK
jgi:hypothetical protein